MTHTPGPWAISELSPTDIVLSTDETFLASARFWANGIDHATAAANARIIAAAPDLLHALHLMLREHDALQIAEGSTEDRWRAATIARAVITKATGEA